MPFIDHNKSNYFRDVNSEFCDDVYGMSFVVAEIFPEFFHLEIKEEGAIIRLTGLGLLTPMEYAIKLLIDSMQNRDRKARCTCADAILFCQKILQDFNQLSNQKVDHIASTTIKKTNLTVDDVCLGVLHR